MSWLWNRRVGYFLIIHYAVFLLAAVISFIMNPGEVIQEVINPFPNWFIAIVVWHIGCFAQGLFLVLVYYGIKYLVVRTHQGLRYLTRDSRLLRTKKLYDAGVLTEEEYQARLSVIKQ